MEGMRARTTEMIRMKEVGGAVGVSLNTAFAFSDFVAFGVLRAIREQGLKVPTDVAVVGLGRQPVRFVSGSTPHHGGR